jgi:hypothetical protein
MWARSQERRDKRKERSRRKVIGQIKKILIRR